MNIVIDQLEIGTFPERLKLAIGEMSTREFANKSGFSPAAIYKYLAGKSEPSRPVLISMAKAAGVNIEWLMTGKGLMRKTESSELADIVLYNRIIETVENCLSDLGFGRKVKAKDKKKIYLYMYDEFKENLAIDRDKVSKFVNFFVTACVSP
jgi:transcriptional regulator with XRE-family HTH domain